MYGGLSVSKVMILLAASAAMVSMPASAALIGDFRLDGTLANQVAGPLAITNNNGGVLGATGISFGAGQGPDVSGFASPSAYSVETRFTLATVSGYRRLLDFLGGTSDSGLYVLNSRLNFYPITTGGTAPFAANTPATLVFTRNGAGDSVGYVNGVQMISFTNASETALTSTLRLFRDDGIENSAGSVDYVRIYDTALTAAEVQSLTPPSVAGAVPEPATWAMMIIGFGLMGASMRRRALSEDRTPATL
jgi:hypothetical protein